MTALLTAALGTTFFSGTAWAQLDPAVARPALPAFNSDEIGYSVAISGNVAVVGAPGVRNGAGAAEIFTGSGGSWHHQATLADPRGASNDAFAYAVAVSSTSKGTYVVIGGNNTNGKSDVVYVYTRAGSRWHLQSKIAGGPSAGMFGDSVAISGSALVIGASCYHGNSGEVFMYKRSGSRWIRQARFVNPAAYADNFAESVSVSGTTALIGAGDMAYVFSDASGRWKQSAVLSNPGLKSDLFGRSVAVSGRTAVIGAPGVNVTNPGRAFVYTRTVSKWTRQAKLTDPPGPDADWFGYSVAIAGTRVLIGEPIFGKVDCGTAYEYVRSGHVWVKREHVSTPSCADGAGFGSAVALSGRTAIIGAPLNNEKTGTVYVAVLD